MPANKNDQIQLFSDPSEVFNIEVLLVMSSEEDRTQTQTASMQSSLLNKRKKCKTNRAKLPATGLETKGTKEETKPQIIKMQITSKTTRRDKAD